MSLFLQLNFLASLFGTIGSLYFSEVMQFPPCTLCWYQRIFFYPLVVIFGVAIWKSDRGYLKYAFPLIVIGLMVAIYHNLLYYGVIAAELTPCTQGVSCSTKQLEMFGFITIPLLSMVGFLVAFILLILDSRTSERVLHEK